MTHYFVLAPEVGVAVTDCEPGPMEYYRPCVSVEAKNKREAKSFALKEREMQDWVVEARGDNKNPFSGLEVLDPVCKHGICWCDLCGGECEECYKELDEPLEDPQTNPL